MCLLIYSPKRRIPREHLENGLAANDDGWGIWHAGIVYKGLTDKGFWETWDALSPGRVVVHFRWGTHGGVNLDNCHPAPLTNGALLFHNGVIHEVETQKGESDTRAFGRLIQRLDLRDKRTLRVIKLAIGNFNKLVIVHEGTNPKSKVAIVNEQAGEWESGIWYSNTGYKWKTYRGSRLTTLVGEACAAPVKSTADVCAEPGGPTGTAGLGRWCWAHRVWSCDGSGKARDKSPYDLTGDREPVHLSEVGDGVLFVSRPAHKERRPSRGHERGNRVPRDRDPMEHGWSLGGSEDRALEKALGKEYGKRADKERSDDSDYRRSWGEFE